MILIVGTFRLPPGKIVEARSAMERMIAASRAEPGCLEYCYAEDVLEPGLIRVSELWHDQDALDRHFASKHIAVWRAQWPRLEVDDRLLHAFKVAEPRPV